MYKRIKEKRGFTIVELLAVIVLMAIVAVMGFVGVRVLLKSGKRQTLNTKTDLIIKNAVTYADESAAIFNGCYCKIDNKWTDCRIITVQELIDQGAYTTTEKCADNTDCILNDLYDFRDDDDVDFKKESLNEEGIVLFKRNNQFVAEFTATSDNETIRTQGCSYSNIKAQEVKIVTMTNKSYVSFDDNKNYYADDLYYDITFESDLPIISIKYCTSTGANCDQFNKTIQAKPNVKHYKGELDIKVSNPVRLCVQAVDEMKKVTTQCSNIYYYDPSNINAITTSTPRCYINGSQSTTNCPISGTNRYIADYTEVDYSTTKEKSKYNYYKKLTIENSSGKSFDVTASSKGTETNSAGKYANTFTAINSDTINGKVISHAASGNEYKPINYKLTYKVTDTSEHSKSTTSSEMNVIIKYKVIYNANGGTGSMDPSIFRYNENVTLRTNTFTRTGYDYKGWARQTSGTVIANSGTNYSDGKQDEVNLYAQWSAKPYAITLVNSLATVEGTKSVTATYDSSELSSTITNPQRKYTITFAKGTSGASFSPTTAQSNWTFTGWYTSDDKMVIGTNGKLVANVSGYTDASGKWKRANTATLYAHWSGGTISVPNPTREGYTCTFGDVLNPPTENKTYTASCSANKYTVTFDKNGGGNPDPASKEVIFDSKYGTLASTTWAIHTFDGWFTEKTGGTKVTKDTIVKKASNHTLYAHWTAICYTGYTLESDGKCHKYYNATANCPTGYTSTGTNCSKTTTIDATANCPSGYTNTGTNCSKTTTIDATKKCPKKYTDNGSKCIKTKTYSASITGYTGECKWGDDGSRFNSSTCSPWSNQTQPSNPSPGSSYTTCNWGYWKYKCNGIISGDFWVNSSRASSECSKNCSGSCSTVEGYGMWLHTYKCSGDPIYSCDSGDSLSRTTCTHTDTKDYTYSCPSGYTLNGKKCSKTVTKDYTYSCPTGYTLSNKKCSKTETQAYTYSCPSGGTVTGTKCNLVRNLGE